MPRKARIKPTDVDAVYHVCNRAHGDAGELPFGDVEKEEFIKLLHRLAHYYCVYLYAYAVMGNHYHLLVRMPGKKPSNKETARRYAEFYGNKRSLDPSSERCSEIAGRLRDISWFAGDLQQRFTTWFNHSRGRCRRGSVWAGRFKSCVFECETSVAWDCLKYIELNPVRAGIVDDAAEYRFSSWGEWNGTGRHPDQKALVNYIAPSLADRANIKNSLDLKRYLQSELARITASEKGVTGQQLDAITAAAASGLPFHRQFQYRCRYWIDGAVIGSKAFIRKTVPQNWEPNFARRRLKKMAGAAVAEAIYSYRSLRRAAV